MTNPGAMAAAALLVAMTSCSSGGPEPAATSPDAAIDSAVGTKDGAVVDAGSPRTLRVYVAGESIERRNHYVEPPFVASGALNERGGGALRNDNDEYGWMPPLADRLAKRDPGLTIEWVGAEAWLDADDAPYSGTYPSTTPASSSAISGTTIDAWLEQRRAELTAKTFCYDVAIAARGGNDFGLDDDAVKASLEDLIATLAAGSSCNANPLIYVTGHMPDDQRGGGPPADAAYVADQKQRFVVRFRDVVSALATKRPALRVRFVDLYTPFLDNKPTTAFPAEVWSKGGVPDYVKIGRIDDTWHIRRLASIYCGELFADAMDLAELHAL